MTQSSKPLNKKSSEPEFGRLHKFIRPALPWYLSQAKADFIPWWTKNVLQKYRGGSNTKINPSM